MMKTTFHTLLVLVASISCIVASPKQAKIEMQYEGLSEEWLTALASTHSTVKDGVVAFPVVTMRNGQSGAIEVIREHVITADAPRVDAGVICNFSTVINAESVLLSGSVVLRRLVVSRNKENEPGLLAFDTREIHFNQSFESGQTTVLMVKNDAGEQEQIIVTATIVDAAGRATISNAEQDGGAKGETDSRKYPVSDQAMVTTVFERVESGDLLSGRGPWFGLKERGGPGIKTDAGLCFFDDISFTAKVICNLGVEGLLESYRRLGGKSQSARIVAIYALQLALGFDDTSEVQGPMVGLHVDMPRDLNDSEISNLKDRFRIKLDELSEKNKR